MLKTLKLLKTIHLLVDQLCIIFNKSLSQGIIPDRLKVSKIIPVYKKKSPPNFENYRPISLLPFFSKILEKVVHKRLYSHLQINDILIPEQFGFRENLSTSMGVLNIANARYHKPYEEVCIILY